MKQTLFFLWDRYISMILWVNLVLGAMILGLNYLFPRTNLFSTYLVMYPLFPIIFLLIYGYTLTTLYQNLALSFQCRRTDLFWGSQAAFLATGLGCGVLTAVMGLVYTRVLDLSALAAYEDSLFQGGIIWAKPEAIPVLLIAALTLQPMGAGLGSLYEKHKIITTVIFVALMILGVLSTVLCLFLSDGTLSISRPVILGTCVGFVVLGLVGEIVYCRSNKNAVVR